QRSTWQTPHKDGVRPRHVNTGMRIAREEAVEIATGQIGGNLGNAGAVDTRHCTAHDKAFHHIRRKADVVYCTCRIVGDFQAITQAEPEDRVQDVVQTKWNQRTVKYAIDKPAWLAAA